MRVSKLTLLTVAIVATGVATASPGTAATVASSRTTQHVTAKVVTMTAVSPAVVLVNQPANSICSGRKFKVGVWYQSFSGGSRAYRVSIWGPRHKRFFFRQGLASPKHWRFWRVLAGRHGRYRVVYAGHKPGSTKWTRFQSIVHVKHCAS